MPSKNWTKRDSRLTTAVWWVRRDLRLTDNQALASAMAAADVVIPVFIRDPARLDSPGIGEKRLAFLLGGLRSLNASLRAIGSRLIIRRGDPTRELAAILSETGAAAIFAEEDHAPYARRGDAQVAGAMPLHLSGSVTVHPPQLVLKADGSPYSVFTPFSRTWKALPPPVPGDILPAPDHLSPVPDLTSLAIPDEPALPTRVPFVPGETEARKRLSSFVAGADPAIYHYVEARDRLDQNGTSKISPYLRFGILSARQATVGALSAIDNAPGALERRAAETWLNELIWREFYHSILYHFPRVQEESFRTALRKISWSNDESAFAAWCEGRTGYPVVDAAMHELVETGWMHNRARMIVASFLVKDLLIDWRWGERYFMHHLVDGDPAANNGGWQWTAGTGTDAAPYFRIFNPVLQGKKYDPAGTYVRRWLPELARVPDRYIHAPWEMPQDIQRSAGCIIGQSYPEPIIDHARARDRALLAYQQARQTAQHKE
jgi:deoxyribodipyrimidine photo-lyase